MKIKILSENLTKILSKTSRVVSSKTQLSVLQNLLLVTKDNWLSITATNMETTVKSAAAVKQDKEGNLCVSAKLFTELIASLPQGTITLEEKEGSLQVITEQSKSTLSGTPATEYPPVNFEDKGKTVNFDKKDLLQALNLTLFAAATDEGRPLLTGIKIQPGDNNLVFASTDGYRLSVKKLSQKSKTLSEMVIPARSLNELFKIITEDKGDDPVLISNSQDGQMIFTLGETKISTRLIDGEYPDFEKIIPKNHNTQAKIDKTLLTQAVKSAAIFARDNANIVKLSFSKNSLSVSANAPQVGSNIISLDCETEGEGGDIAFNSRFLIDLLNNFPGNEVLFEMTGTLNPGVFKSSDDEGFLHIIMPVRVQG